MDCPPVGPAMRCARARTGRWLQSASSSSMLWGMAGMYSLKDLMTLVLQQGAEELRLEPDRPPMMLLHGKVRVLDGPLVTSEQVSELFHGIAPEEQRRELDLCGGTSFRYAAEHSAQFSVRASMRDHRLSLTIKNLAR
jgi:Tfp pilus assembly ATPase PilU